VKGPAGAQPKDIAAFEAAAAGWYPLALARELEDAILSMRTNELEIGTWLIKTEGDVAACWRWTRRCWHTRATGWCARRWVICAAPSAAWTCRRAASLRSSSRFVLRRQLPGTGAGVRPQLPPGAADDEARAPKIAVGEANFGIYPMITGQSGCSGASTANGRHSTPCARQLGQALDADAAFRLGLVTATPTISTGPTRRASRSRSGCR